jgi:hypothetical protein
MVEGPRGIPRMKPKHLQPHVWGTVGDGAPASGELLQGNGHIIGSVALPFTHALGYSNSFCTSIPAGPIRYIPHMQRSSSQYGVALHGALLASTAQAPFATPHGLDQPPARLHRVHGESTTHSSTRAPA